MGEVIDVSALANAFREEIRAKIGGMKGAPLVVGFLGNDDPEARKYANMTKRACEKDGIRFEVRQVGRTDLEDALYDAVRDSNVHGIMIYYPAFGNKPSFYGGTMDDYLRDSVIAQKDIEGLCFTYRYNLYHNIRYMDEEKTKKCVLPCTALSIAKILEWIGIYDLALVQGERLRGKKVTIFNRSEIVGRPLAAMLANDGAEVFSVDIESMFLLTRGKLHETTETPESACRISQVIITGVPSEKFKIPAEWISENSAIVNFAGTENVDRDEILKIPGVKYVPLIGKVTVAMLERNALRLYENFAQSS